MILSPLLCTGEASPEVLHPDVESSVQERHRPVGAHPEEGHKNDPRDGTPLLQEQRELRLFSLKKRRVQEDLSAVAIRKKLFSRVCYDRTREMVSIKEERLSGEVVEAPSLETFKVRLDGALSNLISLQGG